MALYNVVEKGFQSKILGVRSPQGDGKDVGYLPGTLEDKTDNFFLPLVQQLNGGEFELESLKQRGVLESNIPFYMKGTTYNETIIVVDEAEDLDDKQIRLVGTRVGKNSKIYFSGDYKQSVVNTTSNNALIKMCNEFKGNKCFATIYLGEDVRSSTSKMFASLFQE
jgi:predicted ribonuclease YlaK